MDSIPSPVDPFGLYIHIPFCERKCPYCDFNTYAGLGDLFERTVDALCAEMAGRRSRLGDRPVTSVFVGGGTPTVLADAQLEQLMAAVHASFSLAAGCEITFEANPGTVDRDKFGCLRSLGVNRLSIGVQSFQPEELRFLGRIHDVEDVYRAFDAARTAGFGNINLDFIFGLPHQEMAQWQDTLGRALALGPEHLSLYSLIVEPNTPLYHWVATGKTDAPDEDMAGELYEATIERLAAAGYVHYEVSNWAKPGSTQPPDAVLMPEYACRHNLVYWRNQEYLGIGPGAHSHLRRRDEQGRAVSRRWSNHKPVPGYVRRVQQAEPVEDFAEEVGPRLSMGETMMMGLRLVREGVERERFQALHRCDMEEVFAAQLRDLQAWGMIETDAARVRTTRRGLLMGNQTAALFLPDEAVETDALEAGQH